MTNMMTARIVRVYMFDNFQILKMHTCGNIKQGIDRKVININGFH